ncbi:MAG: FoF1 ATP synthase subunit gamma [Roseburia hominis]
MYIIYTQHGNSSLMNDGEDETSSACKGGISLHPIPADIYQEEIRVESSMEAILEHVVPNYVTGYIYCALVESFASEHNSRMMAMQAATDSAKDMIQTLSIEYNRGAAGGDHTGDHRGDAAVRRAQKNKKQEITCEIGSLE